MRVRVYVRATVYVCNQVSLHMKMYVHLESLPIENVCKAVSVNPISSPFGVSTITKP